MIRGIAATVRRQELVAGAFYLHPAYNREPFLIQAITAPTAVQDGSPVYGLVFEPGTEDQLSLMELDQATTYALMPEVSIRIDPPSLSGTSRTLSFRRGMFFVSGEVPFVIASSGFRGYSVVNLATGSIEHRNFDREPWVSFNRWQLVVDENGEEVPIASFGAEPQTT
jgi:hypothetical protein